MFRAACSRRRSLLFYPGFRPAVLFANDRNFRQETANWEFVIANVDRIQPAFLVVTGDLTNKTGDTDQIAEYKRINARLNTRIHIYSVPGNHDVGNEPTPALLAAYRKNYGPDYYSFREDPSTESFSTRT